MIVGIGTQAGIEYQSNRVPASLFQQSNEKSFLVRLVSYPDYTRTGLVRGIVALEAIRDARGTFVREASGYHFQFSAIHVPWRNAARLVRGHSYIVRGKLKPLRVRTSSSYDARFQRRGVHGYLSADFVGLTEESGNIAFPLAHLREEVITIASNASEGHGGDLLAAMLLGARDQLSYRVERAFRALGLSHLLVVSGYHVGLVAGIVLWLLRVGIGSWSWCACRFNGRTGGLCLGLVGALWFASLTGWTTSTRRAVIMLGLYLVAGLRQIEAPLFTVLVSASFLQCLWYPGVFLEPGFQLGTAALLGIVLGKGVAEAASVVEVPRWVQGLRINLFASAAAGVVSWWWFGAFSLLSPLSNVLLAPVLVCMGFLCGGVALFGCFSGIPGGAWALQNVAMVLDILIDVVLSVEPVLRGARTDSLIVVGALVAILAHYAVINLRTFLQWQGRYSGRECLGHRV